MVLFLIRADRKRLPAISPPCVLQWSRSGIVVSGAIDYCKGPGGAVERGRGRFLIGFFKNVFYGFFRGIAGVVICLNLISVVIFDNDPVCVKN